jgi:DNA modification methylase
MNNISKLEIKYVSVDSLRSPDYNPRTWSKEATEQLTKSIKKHGFLDPLIVNDAQGREGIVIGGNFRLSVARTLGYAEVPVVHVTISDLEKEKEVCLRLNKNTGEFDYEALASFSEDFLKEIGFSTLDIDEIFPPEEHPEEFDLNKELEKLDIKTIEIQKGDVWEIGTSRLACGDSMVEEDILRLMGDEKADMCMTDPPYLLDYLKGKKKNGKPTEGFGLKRDRKYLGTDVLPPDFTEKWMANIAKIQKPDFSIVIFENPKNLRTIWNELEKHWKYRNTITWHVQNRMQGFSAKYKFFNKTDIALVGTAGDTELNLEPEEELFQNEYENALFATSGKPHWESYEKGKKICPTDFIEHTAGDKKSSGQEIIFGTKPLELLIPYIKVLTKRGDLVVEPFGGSGSSAAAAIKIGRRCFINEKSPVYAEVIRRRLEKLTGLKAKRIIHGGK